MLTMGYGCYLFLSLSGKLLVHNYAGRTDFVCIESYWHLIKKEV